MTEPTITYCGIRFWNDSEFRLIEALQREGGHLVVPSGPGLCTLQEEPVYYRSLREADFAIIDSGYFALIMTWDLGHKVCRISGLRFLQALLGAQCPIDLRAQKILWVMPTVEEESRLRAFLDREKFDLSRQHFYQAPFYRTETDLDDLALSQTITELAPDWVIVCIAGGKQEKLGYYLRQRHGRSTRLVCTGAAIAFLTGGQAKIPTWADRLFLGWLFRIFEKPGYYLRRYFDALRLPLVVRRVRRAERQSAT